MNRNYAITAVIGILFAGIGVYFGNQQVRAATPQNAAASKFFASEMLDQAGQSKKFSQWKGKTLLVNFWATWCNPCVEEMPELSALQTASRSVNMQIIGIGIDSAANILKFSTKYKISYPLYVAGTSGIALLRDLGDEAGGLPFSVLIGPNGQIKKTYLGRLKIQEVKRDLASP